VIQITAQKRYFIVGSDFGQHREDRRNWRWSICHSPSAARSKNRLPLAPWHWNLKTNVRAIPQATSHLWAACYPRFGLAGAKVALIGVRAKSFAV